MNAIFNWSGGKDSSLTLYYVLNTKEFDVRYLLTSVNQKFQRISMHGVRVELLDQQAQSIGIPLKKLMFPEMPTMESYNQVMKEALMQFKSEDIHASIFGDIFLEDLREYREKQLKKVKMKGIFPIWKRPTSELVQEFIKLGFKAIVVCVNDRFLDQSFVGREIDHRFLNDLPCNVDPCGENGEFHSFVYAGPIFSHPINVKRGDIVHKKYQPCKKEKFEDNNGYKGHDNVFKNGFWYCDLLPQ